jgi:hypothetical protein
VHLDDEPAPTRSFHCPLGVSDEATRGEREALAAGNRQESKPLGELYPAQGLVGSVPGEGRAAMARLKRHACGSAMGHRLEPSLAEKRGHATGARPELEVLRAPTYGRQSEGGDGRHHGQDHEKLQQGEPAGAAD